MNIVDKNHKLKNSNTKCRPSTSTSMADSETKSQDLPVISEPETRRHIVNHTRRLRVRFADWTVYLEDKSIESYIKAIKKIGYERVSRLGIYNAGYNIVSREERPPREGARWQIKSDGWYIYSNLSNADKKKNLSRISESLNLNLRIDFL